MESLRKDLSRMLEKVSQPVTADMRAYIEKDAPRNASAHSAYSDYYSTELRELVARRDAEIIERHRYRFGDS
jgi:hypothetical protein